MADTVANVVTREMSADEECLVISLAPISSNTAIKAQEKEGVSSPRTNQKRRRSQVVQMEMRSYEFVEVNVNGLHEVTSPSANSSSPSFSRISEKLRRLGAGSHAAHQLQCSVFCGGRGCKYENAARWVEAGTAFPELFCHWVTDDILATARPSTLLFREHNLIKKFKDAGISSVINLQLPGEHPHCGPGLDDSSGFTYDPEELMRNDIFFYNYGWPDYGVPSLFSMLDTVKVVDFACSSGKVAVHCHAGLGRTGVLISCYLVYSRRVTAEEAISLVKSRRPGSVQTRGQIELVHQFANHIRLLWRCYPSPTHSFTLKECLDKQALLLHGDKKRSLRNVPRVVHGLCSRMKELSEGNSFTFYCLSLLPPPLPSPSRSPVRTVMKEEDKEGEEECWVVVTCMQEEEEEMRRRQQHQRQRPCCSKKEQHYLLSLLTCCDCLDSEWARRTLTELELEFNSCWEWPTLAQLTDLSVLIDCLFSFLKRLKEPLLSSDEVHSVMANKSFHLLPSFKKHTLLLILDTVKIVVPRPLLVQHVHSISNHIATLVTTPTRPRPHESHDSPITVEQITAEYLINEQ